MIEPTESEDRRVFDRFCDAFISIHGEIRAIETGESDRTDNPLHNAPRTAASLLAADWSHPYTRESAAYPDPASRQHKYWPRSAASTTSTATKTSSAPATPWRRMRMPSPP